MNNYNLEIVVTIIGALVAIFKWVFEYTKQKKWEKNKFLLDKLEHFFELETTKVMHNLLDWNGIKIKILDSDMYIDDNYLFHAFETHDTKHQYTKEEKRLREIFDEYFDNLTKLIFMTKNGLIDKKGFNMFMAYWLNILSGRSNNKSYELKTQIHKYLGFYGFDILKDYLETENY